MSSNDRNFEDSLNDFMHVLHGRKYSLVLNHDQRIRAGYVQAASQPCWFCGGKCFQVGKFTVPLGLQHLARFVLYSVCEPCFKEGDVQNRAKRAILEALTMDTSIIGGNN